MRCSYTVDGKNPANRLRLVVEIPSFTTGFSPKTQVVTVARFLNHQQYGPKASLVFPSLKRCCPSWTRVSAFFNWGKESPLGADVTCKSQLAYHGGFADAISKIL